MSFQLLEKTASKVSSHWKSCVAVAMIVISHGSSAATNVPSRYVLAATNVLNEQLFVFAPSADIAGTIADDAIIGAAIDARLSGTVSNDLWMAAGQSVDVSGRVGDHARLASVAVEASGDFARSLLAFGQSVHLATNSTVAGEVNLAGFSVAIEGRIGSNATIMAMNSATIGGHVAGSVRVTAEDISVLPNARIDGDLVYVSSKELFLDKSVTLGGKLVHEMPPVVSTADLISAQFAGTLMFAFSAMMAGTLFVMLFPRFTGNTVRVLRQATWRCLLTGAFAFTALPLMGVLAISSGIVAPFGAVLLGSFGLLMYAGNILVALTIGSLLLRQQGPQPAGHAILTLALGIVVLYVLKAVPFIGFLLALVAWFAGTGALLLNMIHSQRNVQTQQPPALPGGDALKKDG